MFHQDPKVSMFPFMVSTPQEFLHVLDESSSGQRSVLSLCFTVCSIKSLPVNEPLNFQRSSGLVALVDGCSVSVWGYSLLSTFTLDCPEPKHCLSLCFALAVIQIHLFPKSIGFILFLSFWRKKRTILGNFTTTNKSVTRPILAFGIHLKRRIQVHGSSTCDMHSTGN